MDALHMDYIRSAYSRSPLNVELIIVHVFVMYCDVCRFITDIIRIQKFMQIKNPGNVSQRMCANIGYLPYVYKQ